MNTSIKISNLEETVKDDFVKTAKESNITQKELFVDILNTYKLFKIKFSSEEKEQFNNVISTFPDLFSKRIKHTIKKLNERLSWSSNENETDMDEFIRNQEHISRMSEQKYREQFMKKIIGIITI